MWNSNKERSKAVDEYAQFILYLICLGIFFGTVLKSSFGISLKILIFCGIVFFVLIINRILSAIDVLNRNLNTSIIWTRLLFIAIETKRLTPRNKTPAWDILEDDTKKEEKQVDFRNKLGGGPASVYLHLLIWMIIGGLYLAIPTVSAWFTLNHWPQISNLIENL